MTMSFLDLDEDMQREVLSYLDFPTSASLRLTCKHCWIPREVLFERYPNVVKEKVKVAEEMGMKGYVDLFCFFELFHSAFFISLRGGETPYRDAFILGMIKTHSFHALNETFCLTKSSIGYRKLPDLLTFDFASSDYHLKLLEGAIAIGGDFDLFKFYFLQAISIPTGRVFMESLVESSRLVEFVTRTMEEYPKLLDTTTAVPGTAFATFDSFLTGIVDSALMAGRFDLIDLLGDQGKLTFPPPGRGNSLIYQRPYKKFSSAPHENENKDDYFQHDVWDLVPMVKRGRMLRFLKYFCIDKSISIPIQVFSKRMLKEKSFELLLLCDSLSPGFIDNLSAELVYRSLLDIKQVSSRSQFTYIRDVIKRRPDIITQAKTRSPEITTSSKDLFSVIFELGNHWIHSQKDLDDVTEMFQELYRLGEIAPHLAFALWEDRIKSLHSKHIDCSDFISVLMEIPQILSEMLRTEYQNAIAYASLDKISSIVQRRLVSSFENSEKVPLSAVINDDYPPELMAKLVSEKLRYSSKLTRKHGEDAIATFLRCCGQTASISDFMTIFGFFEELGLASELTYRVKDIVSRCSLDILKALSERGFPFFGDSDLMNFSSLMAVIASDCKSFQNFKEKVDILSQLNPDWPPPGQVDLGRFLAEADWSKIDTDDTILYLDYFLERGAIVTSDVFIAAMDCRDNETLWKWLESHSPPINESTLQRAMAIAEDNDDPAMLIMMVKKGYLVLSTKT